MTIDRKKSRARTDGDIKTIVVIGHLVWDRIRDAGGSWKESFGGTAYSLAALGSRLDETARVYPVCGIGHDLAEKARVCFGRFSALDLSLMRHLPRKNKIHQLIYRSDGCREEFNFGEMPIIRPPALARLPRIDLALINYIGGDEFPPRYIRQLKRNHAPLIYLDYHSLALGKQMQGRRRAKVRRYLRYNPHWKTYAANADIFQMNHYELQSIMPGIKLDTESVVRAAIKIHGLGPQVVIITREADDLVIVHGPKRRPQCDILPVMPVKKLVDPTGCGDTFAAAFIADYIWHRDVVKAARRGLELAARKAGFSGIEGFMHMPKRPQLK